MARKSEAEVELIRESARWCEHAHRLLQANTRPGTTEAHAGLRAGYEATLAMLDALGPVRRRALLVRTAWSAGYRGRIGRAARGRTPSRTTSSSTRATSSSARRARPIWGYNAELERAMIVGAADRRDATTLRPHASRRSRSLRRAPTGVDVRRRRPRSARVLRGRTDPLTRMEPARRPRDRAATTRRRSSTSATRAVEPGMVLDRAGA